MARRPRTRPQAGAPSGQAACGSFIFAAASLNAACTPRRAAAADAAISSTDTHVSF
jgi:hypothetical protein